MRRLAVIVLYVCACQGTPAVDRSPGARPAQLVAVFAGRPDDAAKALEVFEPLLPVELRGASLREVLGHLLPFPPGVVLRPDAPVVLAAVGDPAAPEWAVAFFGQVQAASTTTAGGPRGSRLVGSAGAVDGDRIVLASRAEVLATTFPWLAYDALSRRRPRGWHAELRPRALSLLRGEAAALVRRWRARALREIAEERQRRPEPPLLDPEALVAWSSRQASAVLGVLGDGGGLHAHLLEGEGDGMRLHVELTPRAGTRLARRLAAEAAEAVAPVPLGALPAGTAFAWWRARPESSWSELFLDAAGERLEPERAAALRRRSASPPSLVLAAGEAPGAWALAGGAGPTPAGLDAALGARVTRDLLGAALGCERADTELSGGRARLCGGAPSLFASERDGRWTVALAREPLRVRWARRGPGTLGADPRAALGLPEEASGVLFLDPARLVGGLRRLLVGTPALSPRRSAPAVVSWRRLEDRVAVDLFLAPGALAELAAIGVRLDGS